MSVNLNLTTEIKPLWLDDTAKQMVTANQPWSVQVKWRANLGELSGIWHLRFEISSQTSDFTDVLGELFIPSLPGPGEVMYTESTPVNAGRVPPGAYTILVRIFLLDEEGNQTPYFGFLDGPLLIVDDPMDPYTPASAFSHYGPRPRAAQRLQFEHDLTPTFLQESLGPFLKALADLQGIIDDLRNQPSSTMTIVGIMGSGENYG